MKKKIKNSQNIIHSLGKMCKNMAFTFLLKFHEIHQRLFFQLKSLVGCIFYRTKSRNIKSLILIYYITSDSIHIKKNNYFNVYSKYNMFQWF